MRNINKSTILATKYQEWVTKMGESHIKYTASNKYYLDVVMNLFYCQAGVCAYTEMPLCNDDFYDKKHWQDGKYLVPQRFRKLGELDHFDPSLKKTKGWFWDNFLMAHSDINREKSDKIVFDFLKPDKKDYSPFDWFDYDLKLNRFTPHAKFKQEEEKHKEIKYMIDTLGLNHDTVVAERKRFLREITEGIEFGIYTWDKYEKEKLHKFFTAFKFCKRASDGIV